MNKHPHHQEAQVFDDTPPEDFSDEDAAIHHDVQTILSWHAPGRPFRRRSFEYFLNSFLLVMAIEIILFLFSQYLLMVVVLSLVFLSFALALVPPTLFYYKITSEGIRVENHFFIWDELYDFYFMKQHGMDVLMLRTKAFLPGELTVTLGDIPVNQVKAAILPFLPFREYVEPTMVDKASTWLEKNFPLERRSS